MEFQREENRIWLADASGQKIAHVIFPARSEGVVTVSSTYVDPTLRGQGVASRLMEALTRELRESGRKAVPVCSYAVRWFDEHPEAADLLAEKD